MKKKLTMIEKKKQQNMEISRMKGSSPERKSAIDSRKNLDKKETEFIPPEVKMFEKYKLNRKDTIELSSRENIKDNIQEGENLI